ncbi:hypothetical protein MTO96_032038 [Rhipicephalus appendiculatus]
MTIFTWLKNRYRIIAFRTRCSQLCTRVVGKMKLRKLCSGFQKASGKLFSEVTTSELDKTPGESGLDSRNEKPPALSLGRKVESPSRNVESSKGLPDFEES